MNGRRIKIQNPVHLGFEKFEKPRVGDHSVFNDFRKSCAILAGWKRLKNIRVAQYQLGLIERPNQILAQWMVDAGLASNAGIDLRNKGRRHLHKRDAAQIDGGCEAGEIADYPAPQCEEHGFAFVPTTDKLIEDGGHPSQRLGSLTVGEAYDARPEACGLEAARQPGTIEAMNHSVGDDHCIRGFCEREQVLPHPVEKARLNDDVVPAVGEIDTHPVRLRQRADGFDRF
ncbi:MAG: hypothetical protein Q7R68_09835 [Nitrospirales bacterium]|nr:hypothetical protein [Nitrospirales bacterium]